DRERVVALGDLVQERFGARRSAAMPPPGQRREGARDDRIGCGAGRGDTARDKSRGVELVVGEQNEAAADQIGALLVATPQPGDVFERCGLGEADRVVATVIEPAAFDQADSRVDDRDKGLAAGRPAQTAAGAQPLDLLGAVAALATARDRLRAQQAAADISV